MALSAENEHIWEEWQAETLLVECGVCDTNQMAVLSFTKQLLDTLSIVQSLSHADALGSADLFRRV